MVISTDRTKEREAAHQLLREAYDNGDEGWVRIPELARRLRERGHPVASLTALQLARWLRAQGTGDLVTRNGKAWARAARVTENANVGGGT